MNEFNLYKDIKTSIKENFFLIEKYGFIKIEEEQLAYEYYFRTTNDKNESIDISFEAVSSSPIWIKINNIFIENIIKDKLLDKLNNELCSLYKENIDKYLEFNDTKYLELNFENYMNFGKKLNTLKLNRFFEILGKNFDLLIPKYNEVNMPLKESVTFSKSNTYLKLVMTTAEFLDNFSESKKLVLETDKCDVELYSIEELKDFLKLLTKQQINNIEWKFKK